MDLQKLIAEVLEKLNGDNAILEQFRKDPVGTVKNLLASINLDADQLKAIADGVMAKLNLTDTAAQAKGLFARIKSFFTKK